MKMLEEFKNDTRLVHISEDYDVYIGRPSIFGNPFTHIKDRKTNAEFIVNSREEAVAEYKKWIKTKPEILSQIQTLKGKRIACWCKKKPCHGDVIIEILNK